jgi:hypothetical protein
MKVFKTLMVLFIFTMSSTCLAQNVVEESRPLNLIKEIGIENMQSNFSINPVQMGNILSHTNNIYINQVGSNNIITVNTVIESSSIDLVQNGKNNIMRLSFSAKTAADIIHQQGDNHYLAAFGKAPSLNLQRTVNQSGYGQNLTIHGSNSLSEKMQLNMKGSASTIIIRNFN